VILFFCGKYLAYFFTGDWQDPTTETTAQLLRIISFAMPCLAVVMVLSGALRGAGDTVSSLIFSCVGFFLVRIPLAMWLAWPYVGFAEGPSISGWDLGVQGAWYAMAIDLLVRSILIGSRFLHGGWNRIKI
jgi:Na+-driven multidrug efflux pump